MTRPSLNSVKKYARDQNMQELNACLKKVQQN